MTGPIDLTTEEVPEDWILIEGLRISNTARWGQIPFRLAVRTEPPNSRHHPVGIVIPREHHARWLELRSKTDARKEREKTHANPLTRH